MLKYLMRVFGILIVAGIMLLTTGYEARAHSVREKPPIIKVEFKPYRPYLRAVWIPGHWERKGGKWRRGHYLKHRRRHRRRAVWIPGH